MDPFVGEIRLMPYNFAPRGWALCQGQLMPINQNTALFSLLGTQYGGDGRSTFALPDLRGRTYVGAGQGQGLSSYTQGEEIGTESVTLLSPQLPAHIHTLTATMPVNTDSAGGDSPTNSYYAAVSQSPYALDGGTNMAGDILSGVSGAAGGGTAHENRMPLLVLNYCIAIQGVFPQRQ